MGSVPAAVKAQDWKERRITLSAMQLYSTGTIKKKIMSMMLLFTTKNNVFSFPKLLFHTLETSAEQVPK